MRPTEAVHFLVQIIEIITLDKRVISEDCFSRITYEHRFQTQYTSNSRPSFVLQRNIRMTIRWRAAWVDPEGDRESGPP